MAKRRDRKPLFPAVATLSLVPLLAIAGPAAPDTAQTLAGRYYKQFPDGFVTGEKYTGEDVVEIVPVAPGVAYLRLHLDFYNGHSCGLAGVTAAGKTGLVYREKAVSKGYPQCVLTIARAGTTLHLDDNGGTCSAEHCGARGSLSNVDLPFASKRPIRYMARLKASTEYRDALVEWRTGKPAHP